MLPWFAGRAWGSSGCLMKSTPPPCAGNISFKILMEIDFCSASWSASIWSTKWEHISMIPSGMEMYRSSNVSSAFAHCCLVACLLAVIATIVCIILVPNMKFNNITKGLCWYYERGFRNVLYIGFVWPINYAGTISTNRRMLWPAEGKSLLAKMYPLLLMTEAVQNHVLPAPKVPSLKFLKAIQSCCIGKNDYFWDLGIEEWATTLQFTSQSAPPSS